jgi:hypothetical protein
VSASKDNCAYSCHLDVNTMCEFFDGGFETLETRCLPGRSSRLTMGSSCDGADRLAAAAHPWVPR